MNQRKSVTRAFKITPVIALILVGTAITRGQMKHHGEDTLGVVDFPISGEHASQIEFNRAMTLFHHMTYPQAREAFRGSWSTIRVVRWRTGARP